MDSGVIPNINTEIQLWDMVSAKKIRTLKSFNQPVCIENVTISEDGKWAIARYEDKATLWDTGAGKEKWTIKIQGNPVFALDGTHLAIGGNSLHWVDCNTGQATMILKDSCAFFTCTKNEVLILDLASRLKHWDIKSQSFTSVITVDLGISDLNIGLTQDVRFSQDGTQIAALYYTAEANGMRFKSLDVRDGHQILLKDGIEFGDGSIMFTPNLQYYINTPVTDVADVRAGMSAYSISSGKFSHYFGLKLLETTTHTNMFLPKGKVYNQGKLIYINRDSSFMPVPSTLLLPERALVISGVETDSLKYYAENQVLTDDKRWRVECKDHISYQIYNAANGELVATLLLAETSPEYTDSGYDDRASRIWAVTTPSGLFDASPEMMENLHYVLGMEVIELSQLKERYYEPGLLTKLMGISGSELRNVAALNNVALYPEISAAIENNQLRITLTERSGAMGKLSLFVNGKQMNPDINPDRQKSLTVNLDEFSAQYRADVPNTIGLVAYNAGDWLKSQPFEVPYNPVGARGNNTGGPKLSECGAVKPTLYLLMIGTSTYNDASKNLVYPDLDAAEMAKALSSTGKVLFGDKVQLKLLSTAGNGVEISSKANIEKAFAEYAQNATPCDVLVVYFSGHGSTWGKAGDKTNFYYLTKDITSTKLADDAIRNAYAVSDEELTKWLAAIPAQKQVLILDACNSGKAAETFSGIGTRDLNTSQVIAFELMKDRTGTFILTGSAADMVSFEASQYGQGLLTYSLLEGINGAALKDGKYVDIMTLFQNSRDVVPKLAANIKQLQTPVIAAPKGAASSPIGIKDGSVKINLPQPKPVIIRSNFQDRDNFNDGLGLTQALNGYFHDQTAKGAQARFVYYDIPEFPQGFSIRGNYSIAGDQVNIAGRLFKGDAPVGAAFQVTGSKEPDALVKLILKEIGPNIK
ncbi:MAG TPA: hypothetical protein DCF33_20620 [Saprospirales bacterium]|nr:hypothetical protein [Saprospirales bacterium]